MRVSSKLGKRRTQAAQDEGNTDPAVRLFVYRFLVRTGRAPLVADVVKGMSASRRVVQRSLARLSESHAFMTQENGELWRAAPFSAVPTPFPVSVQKRSYWANCIWDALGIPAMLNKDADIDACCGCCNLRMPLRVKRGRLMENAGLIHIAVPARDWYKDVAFT
jgi:Alkylmercury lyase